MSRFDRLGADCGATEAYRGRQPTLNKSAWLELEDESGYFLFFT